MSRWRLEWRGPRRAVLGVDSDGFAWVPPGASEITECLFDSGAAQTALAALAPNTVDVVVANELAVHWLQQPPRATRSLAELRLVAQARCAHLHGGRPEDWRVAGDWSTRRPFVCSALPHGSMLAVQQACDKPGIGLNWHSAWGVVAARHARHIPNEGWSGLRTPGRAIVWHCAAGQVDALTSLLIYPGETDEELEDRLHVQMRLDAPGLMTAKPPGIHWVPVSHDRACTPARAALAVGALLQGRTA